MADYPGIVLDADLVLGFIKFVNFSGTVVDESLVPVQRQVVGYCYPAMHSPFIVESDPSDGAWELGIKALPSNRYIITALGNPGENAEIFDWLEE